MTCINTDRFRDLSNFMSLTVRHLYLCYTFRMYISAALKITNHPLAFLKLRLLIQPSSLLSVSFQKIQIFMKQVQHHLCSKFYKKAGTIIDAVGTGSRFSLVATVYRVITALYLFVSFTCAARLGSSTRDKPSQRHSLIGLNLI